MKKPNEGHCMPNDAKCASKREQCNPKKEHCASENNKGREERHEKHGASNGHAEHNKFGK